MATDCTICYHSCEIDEIPTPCNSKGFTSFCKVYKLDPERIMRYFEDYEIGKSFTSSPRTITEGDIHQFANLTGDFHPTHFDEDFAKRSFYGERVSHGLLNLSIAMGMMNEWDDRAASIMAFIKLDCQFLKPVKINDSIHAKTSILGKKEWKRPDKGIVLFGLEIINQKGEVVVKAEIEELVWKKIASMPGLKRLRKGGESR